MVGLYRRLLSISMLLVVIGFGIQSQAVAQATPEPLRTHGFALELQGLQSHDTGLRNPGDWRAESKFNERGLALRWEFESLWFVEGRASTGKRLRYVLDMGEDEEGDPQFEDEYGRTRAASLGMGRRVWVNQYFSVMPAVSYIWRQREIPELFSDFNQERIPASRSQNHHIGIDVAAEYRVISRIAVSLNFTMMSSGERQQGLGIAYYFY